jgi:hypothetical protein
LRRFLASFLYLLPLFPHSAVFSRSDCPDQAVELDVCVLICDSKGWNA